ncbi:MAG: peptidylprolyl isomerase [Bacteroidales bacterium]|nr:peptidylprolyl isomerase [Bacteroidales bacterium]
MKKIFFLGLMGLMGLAPAAAQQNDNPVVMEVGGRQIREKEMMKDFMASVGNGLVERKASEAEKRDALNEYVDLYAIFRAKLIDAHRKGLDTTEALYNELSRYRKDLAAPYLIDSTMEEKVMREAYERNHYAVHAQHILVRVRQDAAPEDTLAAYQRALDLRQRVLDGANFNTVAIEEVRRVNPSAQVSPDEGNLGCFSVFDMVYPFENASYSLNPGELSMPVRSRFGYHIIRVLERVPFYGKVTIQHLWLRDQRRSSEAEVAYNRLMEGTSFDIVARQSDDVSTADHGGYLFDATMRQLPPEYVLVISRLQEGEVSKPFLTQYGWHIVKLVKREEIPPYDKMLPYYRQRMVRDPRGGESRRSFAAQARKKYNLVDYTTTPMPQPTKKAKGKKTKQEPVKMMASLDSLVAIVKPNVFDGEWRVKDSLLGDTTVLAEVGGRKYALRDVAQYILREQKVERVVEMNYYVRCKYDEFLDSVSIDYADSQLEKEHAEFAEVVEEYRKGLLIFNYNEVMIWRKALNDSVGFADYYARESAKKSISNPEDSLYFWRTRARAVEFYVEDGRCLDSGKAVKQLRKMLKKNKSSNEMRDALMAMVDGANCASAEPLVMSLDMLEQGRSTILADDQWKRGVYVSQHDNGYVIVAVQDILPPALKGQMEARGYYLNGWQNEVEQNLIQSLREQYGVKVNHNVVSKIRF